MSRLRCIYCSEATTGGEGRAHVFPEAIVSNDVVLPTGAVCNGCNSYLGELDTALATHPLISFGVQTFALPGKKGKPRVELGRVGQSTAGNSRSLSLLHGAIDRVVVDNGKPIFVLSELPQAAQKRFHRALHHVALNLLCKIGGEDEALKSEFDPARAYVRAPRRGEIWPYLYSSLGPNPVDVIDIFCLEIRSQVVIRLFNHVFAVDLLRSGTLRRELQKVAPGAEWLEVPAPGSAESPNPRIEAGG